MTLQHGLPVCFTRKNTMTACKAFDCICPAELSPSFNHTHPLLIANAAMITSVALPNVAFSSPPSVSLVYMASCSVIMPRRCGRYTSLSATAPSSFIQTCDSSLPHVARRRRPTTMAELTVEKNTCCWDKELIHTPIDRCSEPVLPLPGSTVEAVTA